MIKIKLFTEAKHCPAASDVRALIAKPLPRCQSETTMRFFDENFVSKVPECVCCFSCIRDHGNNGCVKCAEFIHTYFTQNEKLKVSKSAARDLIEALEELFAALRISTILVENELQVSTTSFIKDFVKMIDEIKCANDIVNTWHIDTVVAEKVFLLFEEVIFVDQGAISEEFKNETDEDSDILDLSSDSDIL